MERMKRMLFRFTRGRALTHCKTFVQDGVTKVAYLVVFNYSGNSSDRVKKICDSFMGNSFDIPDMDSLDSVKKDVAIKITKSYSLHATSVRQLKEYLYAMNATSAKKDGVSKLEIYKCFVAKEKAIYAALNLLKLH